MHGLMRACVLGLVVATAPMASAQAPSGPEDAREEAFKRHVGVGIEAFTAERFAEALEAFQAARAIREVPNLVFNVARCLEKLGRNEEAITAFERFLALPGSEASERTRALKHLQALRDEMALRAAQDPGRSPVRVPVADDAPDPGISARQPSASRSRALEWTLIGIGGAALVTAGVFGGLALDEYDKFGKATARSDQESHQDSVRTYALVTDITLGVGLASVVTGTVLFFALGDGEPVAALPTGGADWFGVAAQGSF
ncbi:MAG: hypothetical protein AMXMBFR64_01080 [Myxococcales bacterium]